MLIPSTITVEPKELLTFEFLPIQNENSELVIFILLPNPILFGDGTLTFCPMAIDHEPPAYAPELPSLPDS